MFVGRATRPGAPATILGTARLRGAKVFDGLNLAASSHFLQKTHYTQTHMAESSRKVEPPPSEPAEKISMAEFLENCPPNQERAVEVLSRSKFIGGEDVSYYIAPPDIRLHCNDDSCNGLRFFRCTTGDVGVAGTDCWYYFFLTYLCSNCQRVEKRFALAALRHDDHSGMAVKIGEVPPFGPPIPARLIRLLGADRELFLQGRRCENQGLGIGAFVYYRRVVENQKNQILSEILKVAKMVGTDTHVISELEAAMKENQFSKAVDGVKSGIPQTLLIKGHNPLLLLHDALSHGVHGRTDQECLEFATSVRVILVELTERLSEALKDDAELNAAVKKLTTIRQTKS